MRHHDHGTATVAAPASPTASERVREILSYYPSDTAAVKASIGRLLHQGRLAGTGRLVILPVDQGFEHGPHRSFAVNPPAYDPEYHPRFALEALAYSGIVSFILLKLIGLVMPLRANATDEMAGLDVTQHGEEAYVHAEGSRTMLREAGEPDARTSPSLSESPSPAV